MSSKTSHSLNTRGIIERQAIETHFQPITSIRRKQIVGIEAIVALELGGDFLQGFYLARPEKSDGKNINCAWERVEETATKFKSTRSTKRRPRSPSGKRARASHRKSAGS